MIDIIDQELPEDFNEKRKIGENDGFLCQLIRNDSIKEFIMHVTKESISLKSTINLSIYDTNPFLIKEKVLSEGNTSLIEYACFYGSIQIIRYLLINGVEVKPSLWLYAIHGKNPDVIHLLEENKIQPDSNSYQKCFQESIKCYHNDIASYIKDRYLTESIELLNCSLKSHNYEFIDENSIDKSSLFNLCSYYYPSIVKMLVNDIGNEINDLTILIEIF